METVPQLIKEMNFSKQYDDSAAFQAFCPYDNINATAQLCDKIIDKQDSCIEIDPPHNYKKNTLLFCGALTPCNTTLNFMEFLDTLDITENNYIVTFLNRDFVKNPIRLQCITKEFNLISMDYFDKWIICPTITEYLALNIFKRVRFTRRLFRSKVRALFQKEFSRQFFGIDFEKIICYGGLNLDSLYLLTFSNVKEKYILTYPEMHKADKNFSTLLEEIKQSGGNIMPVTDNRLLHSEYLLTDFNLSNQS